MLSFDRPYLELDSLPLQFYGFDLEVNTCLKLNTTYKLSPINRHLIQPAEYMYDRDTIGATVN